MNVQRFTSTMSLVVLGRLSSISHLMVSPLNTSIGVPIWLLMTTTCFLANESLYRFNNCDVEPVPVVFSVS